MLEFDKIEEITSWVIRWSGELITRYHTGKDNKTAYERIRAKACNKPVCQICESVMYMPLDSPKTDERKVEPRMKEGIWLGTNERTEENIIGTCDGVFKCRTVQRRPEGEQWNAKQLQEMQGSVQQPGPGINSDKIPTAIVDQDKRPTKSRTHTAEKPRYVPDKPATRMAAAPRALKIFKQDVEKYDATPGCRASTEVITGRDSHRHTITQNIPHSNDCRAQMTELMSRDDTD